MSVCLLLGIKKDKKKDEMVVFLLCMQVDCPTFAT